MVHARWRGRWVLLFTALTVAAAACGGGEKQPTGQSPSAGGKPEISTINLGLLPLADVAPVHIAIADGLFKDEGLTVQVQIVQGGAAAIPALVSGDLQVTFGNYVSFFLANSQGLPLRIIAEQNRAKAGYTSIMTKPGSGITGPADLVGKKLAVNTLKNVAELTARAQVKDAGGDPDAVQYVEVAFPDMIATLERGDVDAIFAVEPFATLAKQQLQAVEVVNPYGGRLDGFPVAGFQTTAKFAEDNPNTVAAFQRAMVKASKLSTDSPDRVVQILPTYTTLPADLASTITQPEYVSEIDVSKLKVVADLMVEFELLDQAPDVNSLVIPTS